jgi:hypothetical protein
MTNNDDEIKTAPSKVLAAYVVAYRLINSNKDLAIKCMEELFRRRTEGEVFDFESYVEEKMKVDLPERIDLSKLSKIFDVKI